MQSVANVLVDWFGVTSCALVRLVLSMAVPPVQGCMLQTVKSTFKVVLPMYPARMYMYPAWLQLQVCKM